MMAMHRRQFVKTVGAAVALTHAFPVRGASRSPNESLRLAVIGFRGRGRRLMAAIEAARHAHLVAVADVDQETLQGYRPDDKSLFRTDDFRRILDRDDVDAIVSATPNHWHTLLTVLACQAGKHVYIEKPISHDLREGRVVVEAAERYGKLVQCGFQNRSDTSLIPFYEQLHQGKYGKVEGIHGTCYRPRESIGKLARPLAIPAGLNYDLWLGPAEDLPIMRPRLHYDWHWDFNTGNGDVGNQGAHEWDLINWALDDPQEPLTTMVAAGNRFGWHDAGNTPNVMACLTKSGSIPILFEVMDLEEGRQPPDGNPVGVIIRTEAGKFIGGRGGGRFVADDGAVDEFKADASQDGDGTNAHMQNFIDAVFANDRTKLRSDCQMGANSAAMFHMANIALRLGKSVPPEEIEAAFGESVESRDMLARLRESTLAYALQDKLTTLDPWLLGPKLLFDPAAAQFVGEAAEPANQRMSRAYRKGFELPRMG